MSLSIGTHRVEVGVTDDVDGGSLSISRAVNVDVRPALNH